MMRLGGSPRFPRRQWSLWSLALLASGCLPGSAAGPTPANPALIDDVAAARVLLEQERTAARLSSHEPPHRRVERLTDLGLLQDADSLVAGSARTPDLVLAEANLRLRQYRFSEARTLVEAVQAQQPGNLAARRLAIRLAMRAGQLDWAQEQAEALVRRGRREQEGAVLLGRILLLRRDPAEALEWARRLQPWPGAEAQGHLLEAEVRFAAGEPAAGEASIQRALALDPLSADARFLYGYALLRRDTPALSGAIESQWALALELDPLHVRTHWQLGNGELRDLDGGYAPAADSAARAALAPADSLLATDEPAAAIAHTRAAEASHPESLLPALWRGSIFYLRGTQTDPAFLDSAQVTFRTLLSRAPGYRPAHDGVAAVLRQREFRAMAAFDSLEAAIGLTPLPEDPAFRRVFPDLARYPGDRADRMVAQQLGPFLAFVPMLDRQGIRLRLTPLHLAQPTGNDDVVRPRMAVGHGPEDPAPRGARASVGIEALERGSHLDRSVLLQEFARLVHATLTEGEQQRVRDLYAEAVREDRTLDYAARRNEREFFARAVEAYFAPVRTTPLDPGVVNTREELERTDPETYAFVAVLSAEAGRAAAGDRGALRSNLAQMYVNLARAARTDGGGRADAAEAAVLLDSALIQDGGYLPAMLEYALLEGERGRMPRAYEWLAVAEGLEPGYTPLLAARAALLGLDDGGIPGAADSRLALLRQAADRERDPQLRAVYVSHTWELQEALGRLPEAIETAEQFAASAPVATPPLIAARDRALLAAWRMRARAGYPADVINDLRQRVASTPGDLAVVGIFADALVLAGQEAEAVRALEGARERLAAAGEMDAGIDLRLAELALARGDTAATAALVQGVLAVPAGRGARHDGRLARLLISLGQSTEAQRQLLTLAGAREPAERAELAFTRGWISAWRGDLETAERLYREALATDPYHLEARVALVRLLNEEGKVGEARSVVESAAALPLPPGPAFERQVAN